MRIADPFAFSALALAVPASGASARTLSSLGSPNPGDIGINGATGCAYGSCRMVSFASLHGGIFHAARESLVAHQRRIQQPRGVLTTMEKSR